MKLEAPFGVYARGTEIGDANGHVCTAENPEIADQIVAALTTSDRHAKLVSDMIEQRPWCDKPDARLALAIAARAIRRGRHLTEAEKLRNLANAMEAEDVDDEVAGDMTPVVERLRKEADRAEQS